MSSFIFGWAPTVDGDVLPVQPFDPQAPAQSKGIPVMIGTTLHEFTMSTYVPAFRTITKEKAVEFLQKKYGIGIARTGKVQPRAAHLFAQSLCFSATPGHGSVAHYIVELCPYGQSQCRRVTRVGTLYRRKGSNDDFQ